MSKTLKRVLIGLAVLVILIIAVLQVMRMNTKKLSPEDTASYANGDLQLTVTYCRPYKKGREIFGGLVPYNVVWRTGANEATTFTSNKTLKIQGQTLEAGTYTLWTIPGPEEWTVIWNSQMYPWGINSEQKASREDAYDVLNVAVPVGTLSAPQEQFTISFEEPGPSMVLAWDLTRVSVEMEP